MHKKNSWSKKEDRLLARTYSMNNAFDTAKKIKNRTPCAVEERIKKLKLKHSKDFVFEPNSTGDLRPLLRETNEAYYWIGFLSADGNFGRKGCLTLLVSEKDSKHIKRFASLIKAKEKNCTRPNNRKYVYVACSHKINSNKIMKKFGFGHRKTYKPPFCVVSDKDNLFLSYMTGYLDGDGYIIWKTGYKKSQYVIGVGCRKEWKNWLIKNFKRIAKILGICVHVGFYTKKNKYIIVTVASKNFMRLLKKQIKILKIPYLKRKWDKIIS